MNNRERRQARRVADALDVQIYPDSGQGGDLPKFDRAKRFVRLSTTGMRVIDDSALRSRQQVRLIMHLPDQAPVQLTGRVVDTGEEQCAEGQPRYYTSIGFTDVPDAARVLLNDHVERVFRQTHSVSG